MKNKNTLLEDRNCSVLQVTRIPTNHCFCFAMWLLHAPSVKKWTGNTWCQSTTVASRLRVFWMTCDMCKPTVRWTPPNTTVTKFCRVQLQNGCLPIYSVYKPRLIKFFFHHAMRLTVESRAADIFFFTLSKDLDNAQSFLGYVLSNKLSFLC